jgi:hypothetical protein
MIEIFAACWTQTRPILLPPSGDQRREVAFAGRWRGLSVLQATPEFWIAGVATQGYALTRILGAALGLVIEIFASVPVDDPLNVFRQRHDGASSSSHRQVPGKMVRADRQSRPR